MKATIINMLVMQITILVGKLDSKNIEALRLKM